MDNHLQRRPVDPVDSVGHMVKVGLCYDQSRGHGKNVFNRPCLRANSEN